MRHLIDRRDFLKSSTLVAGLGVLGGASLTSLFAGTKPQKFIAGLAPGTRGTVESFWEICDACSALGFHYIETDNTRLQIVEAYKDRTAEFQEEMAKRNLTMAGFVQLSFFADPAKREETIEQNMRIGRFLEAVGGDYIAASFEIRHIPGYEGRDAYELLQEEDFRRFARLADEVGKRLREETGIKFGYHPHSPVGFPRIMDLTNPDYFHLVPDLGHLARGGLDPLRVCRAYRSRIMTVHLKDYDPNLEYEFRGRRGKGRTVVLGSGTIDFPAVVDFLKETEFTGWVHGEHGSNPQDFPAMKAYMVDQLGLHL